MAFGNRDNSYKLNGKNAQKADIILDVNSKMSAKIDALTAKVNKNSADLNKVLAAVGNGNLGAEFLKKLTEVYNLMREECNSLKREMRYIATQNERIYLELSSQIKQLSYAISGGSPLTVQSDNNCQFVRPAAIDYDELAEKVAALLPVQEYISPDYIASKVVEQIITSEPVITSQSSGAPAPNTATFAPVDLKIDEDDLADRIALKLGGLKAEDFDIIVDDEGCSSISESIVKKLNYNMIASAVSQKLQESLGDLAVKEPDYDEMATRLGEKIAIEGVDGDAVAEKTVAVLSEHFPEMNADEIADKVLNRLLENMPAAEVNSEAICQTITDRLIENQENNDYDIVIDEEGLNKITEYIAEDIRTTTEERMDGIQNQLSEIKDMLTAATLVTVSDVVQDVEEVGEQQELSKELAELEDEIDEVPAEGEIEPDDLEETSGGVDFENMMKYNRSFIARIIQSTDEQKEYYGTVKTALLSYAKVNSNIAWGAERFNKGRETIARLKIRGKTLCLYLALDPKAYEYSVYHQVDVSDNKSMHGTPMMIKVKSPRGVKKAIRLIDEMLEQRGGIKRTKVLERNYAAMYPYESIEDLIEYGLVKDISQKQ